LSLFSSGEQNRTAVRPLADMNPTMKWLQKKDPTKLSLFSSGEQNRTADRPLADMNPTIR